VVAVTDVQLATALATVRESWAVSEAEGGISTRTRLLYERHLDTFARFLAAHGIESTGQVTARLVEAWVDAPISAVSPGSRGRAGQTPAPATRRSRQIPIRAALQVWAERGWVDPGLVPTRVISKRPVQEPCPLTPAEATRLRRAGQQSPADTLLPALVALGLAGVNNTEIARLTLDCYDPEAGILRVVGRGGRTSRSLPLDDHAHRVISGHIRALRRIRRLAPIISDPTRCPLALPTAPRTQRLEVKATAVGQHLYRALRLAGIARPGVTPGSLPEYAANVCYARTNRIEDVATLLGLVSLDAVMRLIDREWQGTHASTVREQRD
jgi:site-specific recombinase XerD